MIGKRILSPCFSPNLGGWRCSRSREKMRGFTLVEIIIVIVITGILGGIVAIFIKAPIQQYFDVSRRSDMTDIADTAKVAIYNLGINGANAYAGDNTAAVKTSTSNANIINLTAGKLFPFESPSARFDIINQPVSYVCNPTLGTLTRVSGYSITPTQPTTTFPAGNQQNLLAKNLTNCSFTYDASVVAQRSGLVTMSLTITEANPSSSSEKVTLYNSVHVSNLP